MASRMHICGIRGRWVDNVFSDEMGPWTHQSPCPCHLNSICVSWMSKHVHQCTSNLSISDDYSAYTQINSQCSHILDKGMLKILLDDIRYIRLFGLYISQLITYIIKRWATHHSAFVLTEPKAHPTYWAHGLCFGVLCCVLVQDDIVSPSSPFHWYALTLIPAWKVIRSKIKSVKSGME